MQMIKKTMKDNEPYREKGDMFGDMCGSLIPGNVNNTIK